METTKDEFRIHKWKRPEENVSNASGEMIERDDSGGMGRFRGRKDISFKRETTKYE